MSSNACNDEGTSDALAKTLALIRQRSRTPRQFRYTKSTTRVNSHIFILFSSSTHSRAIFIVRRSSTVCRAMFSSSAMCSRAIIRPTSWSGQRVRSLKPFSLPVWRYLDPDHHDRSDPTVPSHWENSFHSPSRKFIKKLVVKSLAVPDICVRSRGHVRAVVDMTQTSAFRSR